MKSEIPFDRVETLIAAANEPDVWILKGLIEEGDQVVLAGAPKAGKTLMASQIALAVASGGRFLSWQAPSPKRVLYVNLELRPKRFGRRLILQVCGESYLPRYQNLLSTSQFRTLNILDKHVQHGFASLIREQGIELVIWDVLARMHAVEENDNGSMRSVMHAIRLASADKAHIVLHHMRKPPGGLEDVNIGALGMRGASSIHGEADLVISLGVRSGQGARFSVRFSARNIETPDELLLDRDLNLCFYEAAAEDENRLLGVIRSAFHGMPTCASSALLQHIMSAYDVRARRAKQLIQQASEKKWIYRRQRSDRRYEYVTLDRHDLLGDEEIKGCKTATNCL